jgi:hypothetical protein
MKNPSYFIQGEVYWAWSNNPANCAAGRCFRPWICDFGGRRQEQEISTSSFRLRGRTSRFRGGINSGSRSSFMSSFLNLADAS